MKGFEKKCKKDACRVVYQMLVVYQVSISQCFHVMRVQICVIGSSLRSIKKVHTKMTLLLSWGNFLHIAMKIY